VNITPLVKLYDRRTVRAVLADFSEVKIAIHGLDRMPVVGRPWPSLLGKFLEPRCGWYVVAHAVK
jgi:hypothetical protein